MHSRDSTTLEKAEILGTPYVPSSFRPQVLLQVNFPSTGASVQLGNELTPAETKETPVFSFVTEDTESSYAILSFDPDAPSREDQKFGPWRHLIQGGLKVKPESTEVTVTEESLSPWVAPSPGQGTGLHRYCFALYKQTQALLPMVEQAHIQGNERPERRTFKVADFAQQNGLELIGFNFFLVSDGARTGDKKAFANDSSICSVMMAFSFLPHSFSARTVEEWSRRAVV
ncbi:BQ2448_2591 [Microbotryum intermedium]|uniref:BQ2448_2591 protein n=1 Tax=Microbotryum intermedium TaxID=269621 RepID=A0A238FBV3_9BASI|nr:BQ2448_2591 [Microbotryum intermedium]